MNEQDLRDISLKLRDEPATELSFQPSIGHFMDGEFCKGLDRVIHKPGMMWERHKATENLEGQIPDVRGLYMFVWRPEFSIHFQSKAEQFLWVLYVGKAGTEDSKAATLRNRYAGEYSRYVGRDPSCLWDLNPAQERKDRLARYLTLQPLEYWCLQIESVRDIGIFERKLIKLFRPPLNSQHGPKIKAGHTVPAFEEPK